MSVVCRFKFPEGLDKDSIEAQLALAIIAAECIFGQSRVRISAAYCISPANKTAEDDRGPWVAVDVSTEVCEHIAQVFTGLMIRQLGEDKFAVDRVNSDKEMSGNERC